MDREAYWKTHTYTQIEPTIPCFPLPLSPFLVSRVIQLKDKGHPSVWPMA